VAQVELVGSEYNPARPRKKPARGSGQAEGEGRGRSPEGGCAADARAEGLRDDARSKGQAKGQTQGKAQKSTTPRKGGRFLRLKLESGK
jgi:hypothetical protein